MFDGRIVHVLVGGRTPCGMEGSPADWLPNHLWTYPNSPEEQITCEECKRRSWAVRELERRYAARK